MKRKYNTMTTTRKITAEQLQRFIKKIIKEQMEEIQSKKPDQRSDLSGLINKAKNLGWGQISKTQAAQEKEVGGGKFIVGFKNQYGDVIFIKYDKSLEGNEWQGPWILSFNMGSINGEGGTGNDGYATSRDATKAMIRLMTMTTTKRYKRENQTLPDIFSMGDQD